MARVSKKVSAARQEAENAQHRVWKAAIYARLSDFDDVLRDTESLEVQISYIKEYIDHRDDLMLLDVFADKQCTGINFDRPEFERLLKALQERKVNCIVVKDFSRLGRNFVETGQYLEQVFPLFGVRFIAINDNYDSLNSQSRDGMLVPIKQAEYVLEILHERERKALICFSALERQEEKLSAEKAEIVKQRVALYEQYADGNMSKEEFIRQRDAYRVQEDEKMEQIQRLRTEKNQAFQPVKRDTDHLQTVMSTVEEAGDVMYLSQNVVETFIDRIEVFNDEHVKIHFTFENVLADYAE